MVKHNDDGLAMPASARETLVHRDKHAFQFMEADKALYTSQCDAPSRVRPERQATMRVNDIVGAVCARRAHGGRSESGLLGLSRDPRGCPNHVCARMNSCVVLCPTPAYPGHCPLQRPRGRKHGRYPR